MFLFYLLLPFKVLLELRSYDQRKHRTVSYSTVHDKRNAFYY
jgi:hypothetical protein